MPRSVLRLGALALLALSAVAPARAEGPPLAASILPVHGLVAGVTAGVTEPRLLVPAGASPHAYTLRPSDAAALAQARVIVWVGPALETFLPDVLETVPETATILRLDQVAGTVRHVQRESALWGAHDHDHGDDHGHEDAHGHDDDHAAEGEAMDPHLWLDPRNAVAWTRAIADTLAAADPANAAAYRANAAAQAEALEALDAELAAALAPVRDVPFLVFHDGYRYLEERYGLTAVGALSLVPGRPAGARHFAEVRERVRDTGARCIFGEPQVSDQLARRLAEETGASVRLIDPLGRDETRGPGHYAALMRALVADLSACLKGV